MLNICFVVDEYTNKLIDHTMMNTENNNTINHSITTFRPTLSPILEEEEEEAEEMGWDTDDEIEDFDEEETKEEHVNFESGVIAGQQPSNGQDVNESNGNDDYNEEEKEEKEQQSDENQHEEYEENEEYEEVLCDDCYNIYWQDMRAEYDEFKYIMDTILGRTWRNRNDGVYGIAQKLLKLLKIKVLKKWLCIWQPQNETNHQSFYDATTRYCTLWGIIMDHVITTNLLDNNNESE